MQRRKLLAGLGSLAAGGAAAVGSGAFSSVEAERGVSVEVAEDNNAYLGLEAERDDVISDDGDSGQLSIDLGSQTTAQGGEGFNDEAITTIEGVFRITNQGTQEVGVGFVDDESDFAQNRNIVVEKEPIAGVTLEVQDTESFDGIEASILDSGEYTLVDVTVDTLNENPEQEDGSVIIGGYVEDF